LRLPAPFRKHRLTEDETTLNGDGTEAGNDLDARREATLRN
jgi:hypothetical protein